MVDCGSSPEPAGLKNHTGRCTYMPKIPRREWRRRDCCTAAPPGGDFPLSPSLASACALGQTLPPNKKERKERNLTRAALQSQLAGVERAGCTACGSGEGASRSRGRPRVHVSLTDSPASRQLSCWDSVLQLHDAGGSAEMRLTECCVLVRSCPQWASRTF